MSTSFTLDFDSDYIRIRHPVDYEITPESQHELWGAIGEACRKYDCWRVLAESPAPPRRNMNQVDAFKSAGQAANVSSDLRVACVFPEYKTDEITEFFIKVAYNRGVRIEFFSNRDKALEWLGFGNQ
jgi:hypothetical protein